MASNTVAKRCLRKIWPSFNHHHVSTSLVNEKLCHYGTNHDDGRNNNHPSWNVSARRWKSNDSKSSRLPNIHKDNPFDILGVPKNSTYEIVKRRFLELAMETHPDVVTNQQHSSTDGDDHDDAATSKDRKRLADDFVKLRQAFEAIRENSDGSTRLAGDSDDSSWSDESFQAWFHNETGHSDVMFTMDLQTRKEVAEAASQAQGGLDKGGMWEMARAMAEQEKNMGNLKNKHAANQTQRVEAGSNDSDNQRRRRRRK